MTTNNFWVKEELFQIHCELSSYCNAACPLCPRYYEGSEIVRPDLELAQISLEQFKKWFSPAIINRTNHWLFCGTVGDPGMAKDFVSIVDYLFKTNPKLNVTVNTNGGMRGVKDWSRLGEISKAHDHRLRIIFSIDGLEDTNHLYRRNVNWSTLIRNVKAYIDNGGRAEWDYLIFKHNEHQIAEATQFSKDIGFFNFAPKKALGFDVDGSLVKRTVLDREGNLLYWLEPPVELANRNSTNSSDIIEWQIDVNSTIVKFYKREVIDPHEELIENYDGKTFKEAVIDFNDYNKKNIKCKSKTWGGGKEIYVSSSGIVRPCCYVGTTIETTHSTPEIVQLKRKVKDYGHDKFNLHNHTLEEILDAGHLNRVFADSWSEKDNNKIMYCSSTCGEDSQIDRIWTHKGNTRPNKRNWRKFYKKED